ncbi:MAG: rhodanese-like domain-containing protein, partial [Proteobacteria bacterium]|nr:rhodanese-like domain-containing protein [Pseudomonadota bacterium]
RARGAPLSRRALMAGVMVLMGTMALATAAAAGEDGVIAADAAARRAAAGEILVIDVRSPQEWRQTGVAKGARRVTIHDPGGLPGFVEAMKAALGGDLGKPIAVICATGNRSTFAQRLLAKAGFTRVLNIKEGMIGGPYGPGWLRRGLPVESCGAC